MLDNRYFETNVPGIYIVGELGGMGLIRNALRQGRQAVEGIACDLADRPVDGGDGVLDLVIAGAGPAGIAASLTALERGLSCRTVEQEAPGGAVRLRQAGCLACHENTHRGQLATDCLTCHTYEAWKPVSFDHDGSRFRLDGKHVEVRCEQCHPLEGEAEGEGFRRYRPLNTDCAACHQ